MLYLEWFFYSIYNYAIAPSPTPIAGTPVPIWWSGLHGSVRFNQICLAVVGPLLLFGAVVFLASAWSMWELNSLIIGLVTLGTFSAAVGYFYGPRLFLIGPQGVQIQDAMVPWRDVHSYRWNESGRLAELLLITRHERYALRIAAKDVPTVKSLLAEHAPALASQDALAAS